MEGDAVYLCLVYENYRHYRDYNKFHEISLTINQVSIKEKYIDKDDYKMEFFEVPTEYAEKVFRYIQDKYVKSPFPINVRSGELQTTCGDFIKKINSIRQEKTTTTTLSSITPMITTTTITTTPPPSPHHHPHHHHQPLLTLPAHPPTPSLTPPSHKLIALIGNKNNGGVSVVCNGENTPLAEFFHQISHHPTLQVLQYATMMAGEVNTIITTFHQEFQHLRFPLPDFDLSWYRVKEQEVLHWLNKRSVVNTTGTPTTTMADPPITPTTLPSESVFTTPPLFDTDQFIIPDTPDTPDIPDTPVKKRKTLG
jgi:hypothetical protein